jgi:hypothetical protein
MTHAAAVAHRPFGTKQTGPVTLTSPVWVSFDGDGHHDGWRTPHRSGGVTPMLGPNGD